MFLGIDGGGTETAGAILDSDGRILGLERAGASAIIGRPSAESCAVLRAIVEGLCRRADVARESVVFAGVGLSGVDFPDEAPTQRDVIAEALDLPRERVSLVNDGIAALWGATSNPAALIVQHGSGFTSAFRSAFGQERLFDHLNVGKTFDLRAELIRQVARMIDGRVTPTPLRDAVLQHLGIGDEGEFAEAVYRGRVSPARRAGTAPLIFDAWRAGDPVASELVTRAVDDYALAARAMIARLGGGHVDAVFGGGVIAQAPPEFWDLLASRVTAACPAAGVKAPDLPPELGAAVMAFFCGGGDPVSSFRKTEESWLRTKGAPTGA